MLIPPTGVLFASYKQSQFTKKQDKDHSGSGVSLFQKSIKTSTQVSTAPIMIPVLAPVLDFSMNDLNFTFF